MAGALQYKHRVWAEIDLDRLCENYKIAKNLSQSGRLMPVVKADAYGHGAVRCALALQREGADFFAVATPEEAMQLRRHGVECGLLLLGAAPVFHIPALARERVTLCVPDSDTARQYCEARTPLSVHIKIDTGMTRLGLPSGTAVNEALKIAEKLDVTGLFTHFASADDPGETDFTREQYLCFARICGQLREKGLKQPLRHAANSAALIAHPETHLDLARPGLLLYGYSPVSGKTAVSLKPVLSLYTSVTQCHTITEGTTVSYGRSWTARRDSIVAAVPAGYADGLSWSLSGLDGAFMLVRGKKAPIIGRVCMDFCVLDVTDIPNVRQGDIVTVLGDGIDAADHARLLGTIPWEILCSIGRRVPRVYRQNGTVIGEINDLDML